MSVETTSVRSSTRERILLTLSEKLLADVKESLTGLGLLQNSVFKGEIAPVANLFGLLSAPQVTVEDNAAYLLGFSPSVILFCSPSYRYRGQAKVGLQTQQAVGADGTNQEEMLTLNLNGVNEELGQVVLPKARKTEDGRTYLDASDINARRRFGARPETHIPIGAIPNQRKEAVLLVIVRPHSIPQVYIDSVVLPEYWQEKLVGAEGQLQETVVKSRRIKPFPSRNTLRRLHEDGVVTGEVTSEQKGVRRTEIRVVADVFIASPRRKRPEDVRLPNGGTAQTKVDRERARLRENQSGVLRAFEELERLQRETGRNGNKGKSSKTPKRPY